MSIDHRERTFEEAIEHQLVTTTIDALCEYRSALISAAVTGKIDMREEARVE